MVNKNRIKKENHVEIRMGLNLTVRDKTDDNGSLKSHSI